MKIAKRAKKFLLNSSLEISQSVTAATIQGVHEKCIDIYDSHDRKITFLRPSLLKTEIFPLNVKNFLKLESYKLFLFSSGELV